MSISLDSRVFTIDDIHNHLRGLAYSLRAAPQRQTPHDAAYRQGYMDALLATAVSLGIADENILSRKEDQS